MGSDFAVIIRVRQHFGNDPGFMPEVPFAGSNKTYPFSCPDVDTSQESVLLFQALGVSHPRNFIEVNSTGPLGPIGVYGGIPVSRSNEDWNGNVMLIGPNILRENNVLSLGSRASNGSLLGDIDEFLIDNVVVLFKTRRSRRPLAKLRDRLWARS
jgi:hypothetical protein